MRVIALHSPKGGVGRTLTCVALARAFQQHNLRIHVVDASDHADCEVMSLHRWSHRVGQLDPDGMHPLRVTIAPDTGTVLDVLGQRTAAFCLSRAPQMTRSVLQKKEGWGRKAAYSMYTQIRPPGGVVGNLCYRMYYPATTLFPLLLFLKWQ